MDPILDRFAEELRKVPLNPPRIPMVSTVTGQWLEASEACDPGYWVRNLRETVRFSDAVARLLEDPDRVLLEVGPGNVLSSLARQHADARDERLILSSIGPPQDPEPDSLHLLNRLARLWAAGTEVDWEGFHRFGARRRIPLPTYPFQRQRYWIESAGQEPVRGPGSPGKKADIGDWFYLPSWRRAAAPSEVSAVHGQEACWLVFLDELGLGTRIAERLREKGCAVHTVAIGERFHQAEGRHYRIDPANPAHYGTLMRMVGRQADLRVLHLWSVTRMAGQASGAAGFDRCQRLGFYSLLHLLQALGNGEDHGTVRIRVVTNDAQDVLGTEELSPEKATVLGLCRTVPQEFPNTSCQCIDLQLGDFGAEDRFVEMLLQDSMTEIEEQVMAYRGTARWVEDFEAHPLPPPQGLSLRLRQKGVYLITGGLGNIGLKLAEYLARTVKARLVLLGRT